MSGAALRNCDESGTFATQNLVLIQTSKYILKKEEKVYLTYQHAPCLRVFQTTQYAIKLNRERIVTEKKTDCCIKNQEFYP